MSGRLSDLTPAERRRAVALAIVKVFAVWVALFGAYYLAPVSLLGARYVVVGLIGASAVFVVVVAWQVRRIGRAKLPDGAGGPGARAADPLLPGHVRFLLSIARDRRSQELLRSCWITRPRCTSP